MLYFQPTGWWDRENFGVALNAMGLTGLGVEVGTHRGLFAHSLLKQWIGHLTCVDHYKNGYDPEDPASGGDRELDYLQTRELLNYFCTQWKMLRLDSVSAALQFASDELDFVYMDGCHQYLSIQEDIKAWYPKVKVGGILAGHDIVYTGEENGGWGRYVQQAVFEFVEKLNPRPIVWLVREVDNSPWSWFIIKE